jgi:hypothetical protein
MQYRWLLPRREEEGDLDVPEFAHVSLDVDARRIEALGLAHGVERPAAAGVRTGPCRPLPATAVVRGITIDEQAHEDAGSLLPRYPEPAREEVRDDHAGTVVDPALPLKLSHPRIHKRDPGPTFGPPV